MFENMFTTKMSMDKKSLEQRFAKIRSKNGRLSKLIAIVIFALVLAIIAASAIYIAVRQSGAGNYVMTEDEFEAYGRRPIGSVMAELDYADDSKIVFHYLEGFFVVDQQTNEVLHKINLSKLNLAPHAQGSVGLNVTVEKDGRFAYLSSYGDEKEIKDFDDYIINLETGKVSVGKVPEGMQGVSYAMGNYPEGAIEGWCDGKTFFTEEKSYLLTAREYNIGTIELVIKHNKLDMTGYRYVFGGRFVDNEDKKTAVIEKSLADGEEILINSRTDWTVDGKKLLRVYDKLALTMNLPYLDAEFYGTFDVRIYGIYNSITRESCERLFAVSNETLELTLNENLSQEAFSAVCKILGTPDMTSELYQKTEKYLEAEFHRVYDPYYDIQALIISDWNEENDNEATFLYKKTYLNYNRDPDKAEYIQEAKKRSQKEYETLYKDYLALKESNYEFKVVRDGGGLKLYANVAPKGIEWQPIKIDDYIMSE